MDNHGLRYYDPEVGRYITPDPSGFEDGVNIYLYVHNNPINHIDPLGLSADENVEVTGPIADTQDVGRSLRGKTIDGRKYDDSDNPLMLRKVEGENGKSKWMKYKQNALIKDTDGNWRIRADVADDPKSLEAASYEDYRQYALAVIDYNADKSPTGDFLANIAGGDPSAALGLTLTKLAEAAAAKAWAADTGDYKPAGGVLAKEAKDAAIMAGLGVAGSVGGKGARLMSGAVYKTAKEARLAAEALGWRRAGGMTSKGQDVYTDGKRYFTRDIDGHSGGAWKELDRKGQRTGTVDENLKKVGD